LATGLIVTLQVGAASVKASTNLTLDQHYPVDVTATLGKKLPSDVATRIEGIRGIEKAVTLKSVPATVVTERHHKIAVPLESADDLSGVINKGAGDVPKDRILIDPFLAKNYDVRDGSQVKIRAGGTTRTMTIEANRIAADGVAVVAPGVLHAIAPNASVTTVWAKAAQDADPVKISAALSKIVDDHPDLQVSGSLTTKATYTKLLDTLLTIATVLLAVAVVIALIGVGNTLGLSVIERSRESALLRALGLQRRQLRLMLAIEAVLLALAGALVGIAAGAFFGWVGTAAIGSELDYQTTVFSMSGMQTAVVAAIAIIAGVLASVLPARRAARATPVSALAES
jgi:putative ABC transport system permease protein